MHPVPKPTCRAASGTRPPRAGLLLPVLVSIALLAGAAPAGAEGGIAWLDYEQGSARASETGS